MAFKRRSDNRIISTLCSQFIMAATVVYPFQIMGLINNERSFERTRLVQLKQTFCSLHKKWHDLGVFYEICRLPFGCFKVNHCVT